MRYSAFAVCAVNAATAAGRLVNVTIDDTFGDERTGAIPKYTSAHLWNARSATDGCTTCYAQPDGSQFHHNTWHDETTFTGQIPSNMSLSFMGTSIRMYCALANKLDIKLTNRATHLAFYLDDSAVPASTFDHEPTNDPGFIYNQLVFESDNLPLGQHTVVLSNLGTLDKGSLVLFDYAVYTYVRRSVIKVTSVRKKLRGL
ncbi:hypothetical protein EXIGLDRAFT_288776 [Exidia glandulosa HHB12029]|uniref:Uncharacterized protein n=1 Tax=Exidia glandulosa HHB12029 TaxID=1314781 RepID=A0A165DFS6_EXIGL|nr:hypothetical protein EXIGLDRAFT_288776 [Exidia glandulosa HHB12029]